MRLVLDTNVLVAAMRSPKGASARLIEAVLAGRAVLIASVSLFVEYEAVMARPEHLAAAGWTPVDVALALDDLAQLVAPIHSGWRDRPQLRDADDEMVLEAAVNGAADALVTFEVRTFAAAGARFGLEVLTPGEAYARIRR